MLLKHSFSRFSCFPVACALISTLPQIVKVGYAVHFNLDNLGQGATTPQAEGKATETAFFEPWGFGGKAPERARHERGRLRVVVAGARACPRCHHRTAIVYLRGVVSLLDIKDT